MSKHTTLARPYAIAAFEIAQEQGRLNHWSRVLRLLSDALDNSKINQLLASPVHSVSYKVQVLNEIFAAELCDSTRRLLSVVAENHRLGLLPAIHEEFESLLAEANRTLDVEITSAVELSIEQLSALEQTLRLKFDREIEVSTRVDPGIMGGTLIRAGDTVIDSTVRGRIEKLGLALQRT